MKGDRIQVGNPDLPPPGDERREELGRRADDLAEAVETHPSETERADRLRDGVSTALAELGRRYAHLGVKAGETTILPANTREFSARRAESLATQERARREAERTTDQWVREGRMPGAPAPGR